MYLENLCFESYQDLEYNLGTAWDISTASYETKSYNPAESTALSALYMKSDGFKLYTIANTSGYVYQYTMSTGFFFGGLEILLVMGSIVVSIECVNVRLLTFT